MSDDKSSASGGNGNGSAAHAVPAVDASSETLRPAAVVATESPGATLAGDTQARGVDATFELPPSDAQTLLAGGMPPKPAARPGGADPTLAASPGHAAPPW